MRSATKAVPAANRERVEEVCVELMLEIEGCHSFCRLQIVRIRDRCRLIRGGSDERSGIEVEDFRKTVIGFERHSAARAFREGHISGMVTTRAVEEPTERRAHERIRALLKRCRTCAHRRVRWPGPRFPRG